MLAVAEARTETSLHIETIIILFKFWKILNFKRNCNKVYKKIRQSSRAIALQKGIGYRAAAFGRKEKATIG